ncbi:MAG: hypothetical protein IKV14_07485 [Muribaculaceae bacterium]|nr:hypothetical protein [Muribaculaceae bacterium]
MKKFLLLCLTLSVVSSVYSVNWSYPKSAIEDPTGTANTELRDGSKEKPYTISTAQELANFAYYVNNHSTGAAYKNKYVELTADIKLNDWVINENGEINTSAQQWVPIGEYGVFYNDSFEGIFDGKGHTISGVYITKEYSYNGLFGDLKHGSIKNLNVKDSYIVKGSKCTGGLVAYVHGTSIESDGVKLVANCSFQGVIEGNGSNGTYVGGIVGHEESSSKFTIKNCSNEGRISDANGSYIGGICAYGTVVDVVDCVNRMDISGGKDYSIGGISAKVHGVDNCINYGNIDNSTAKNIGGIIGEMTNSISKCVNYGAITISGSKTTYVGGIVGTTTNNVVFCGNFGTINATSVTPSNELYIGGIVGQTGYLIKKCYNHGNINATSNSIKRAGLVGEYMADVNYGNISNCFNTGSISGGYAIAAKVATQGDMQEANVLWLEGSAIQGFPSTDADTKRSEEYFTDNTISGNAFAIMESATGELWGSDITNNGYPIPCYLGGVNTYFYKQGEYGTDANPFIIETLDDVNEIRKCILSGETFEGKFLSQLSDIDFSSEENFIPIGLKFDIKDLAGTIIDLSTTFSFAGVYDGNGRCIKGISVNNTTRCGAALFAENKGVIKNLTFDGFSNVDNSVEPANIAAVAVVNNGTISNVVVKNINLIVERAAVAGVVGTNNGVVENTSVVNVVLKGKYAGGVVGVNNGSVVNTMVYNSTLEGVYVGGIAAKSSGTIDKTSVFNTDVIGSCLGGIAGVTEEGIILHSTSAAVLDSRNCSFETGKQPYMGGIVGLANGVDIQYSSAIADTAYYLYDSNSQTALGGLIGANEEPKTLKVVSSVASWMGTLPNDIQFGPIAAKANINSFYSVSDMIVYALQYRARENELVWYGLATSVNHTQEKNIRFLYTNDFKRTDVEWDVNYFNKDNMVQGYKMVLPKYSPTTYAVNSFGTTPIATYLDMTFVKPTDNTLFEPTDSNVVKEFYDLPNVCNGNTVRNLYVVDGKDFDCAYSLTAENITFERKNIAGWTAMSLPFNIAQDMLPENSIIEEVVSVDTNAGKVYTQTVTSINAGMPFLLYCEDENFVVSLYEYKDKIVTSPGEMLNLFYGTFTATDVDSEYFVLDKSGENFVKSTGNSKVAPFNAYILDEELSKFESIKIVREPTTGVENSTIDNSIEEDGEQVIYDIYGRRVFETITPGVYIINGKKVLKR